MHGLAIIGGILGLLAIAGGQALVTFIVRAGLVLTVAYFAFAFYDMGHPRPWPQAPNSPCRQAGYSVEFCSRIPEGYDLDTDALPAKPTAEPPRAQPGPIHIPLQDVVPVPPLPQPQIGGWNVDDTSGPWGDDLKPSSARAERLLRRFHQAQGVDE